MANQKLNTAHYFPRFIDQTIQRKLEYVEAVEIRGAKWCGKAQSALQHAKSVLMMQDPNKRNDYRVLAETKPSVLLEGSAPRLIDANRNAIDHFERPQSTRHRFVPRYRERLPGSPSQALCHPRPFRMDSFAACKITHNKNPDQAFCLPVNSRRSIGRKPENATYGHRHHGPFIRNPMRTRFAHIRAGH